MNPNGFGGYEALHILSQILDLLPWREREEYVPYPEGGRGAMVPPGPEYLDQQLAPPTGMDQFMATMREPIFAGPSRMFAALGQGQNPLGAMLDTSGMSPEVFEALQEMDVPSALAFLAEMGVPDAFGGADALIGLGMLAPAGIRRLNKGVEFLDPSVLRMAPGNPFRRDIDELGEFARTLHEDPRGIYEALQIQYDPTTGRWVTAEGNHRAWAAAQYDSPVPVEVSLGRIANPESGQPISPEARRALDEYAATHGGAYPRTLTPSQLGFDVYSPRSVTDFTVRHGDEIASPVHPRDPNNLLDTVLRLSESPTPEVPRLGRVIDRDWSGEMPPIQDFSDSIRLGAGDVRVELLKKGEVEWAEQVPYEPEAFVRWMRQHFGDEADDMIIERSGMTREQYDATLGRWANTHGDFDRLAESGSAVVRNSASWGDPQYVQLQVDQIASLPEPVDKLWALRRDLQHLPVVEHRQAALDMIDQRIADLEVAGLESLIREGGVIARDPGMAQFPPGYENTLTRQALTDELNDLINNPSSRTVQQGKVQDLHNTKRPTDPPPPRTQDEILDDLINRRPPEPDDFDGFDTNADRAFFGDPEGLDPEELEVLRIFPERFGPRSPALEYTPNTEEFQIFTDMYAKQIRETTPRLADGQYRAPEVRPNDGMITPESRAGAAFVNDTNEPFGMSGVPLEVDKFIEDTKPHLLYQLANEGQIGELVVRRMLEETYPELNPLQTDVLIEWLWEHLP